MKKTLLALALPAAPAAAHAQPAPSAAPATTAAAPAGYAEQLGEIIGATMRATDPAVLAAQAAKLQRAAALAPADWLPRYYQAYALIEQARLSKVPGAAKDQLLDQADAQLTQAKQLHGDESELQALQALGYQMRLSIDPMQRGQEYSELVMQAADLAKTLNPANPRPYLIEANQLYYTPEEYGGGAGRAQPLYEAAKAKFAAFRPASALGPSWGAEYLAQQLQHYAPAGATR